MMIVVPVVCSFFFLNLMYEGLPLKVPVAIVDNDQSSMSRNVTRQLNAMELIASTAHLEASHEPRE
ncbi:MAG: ABC transporter permease, partial [Duncaniella sp.]|nr:ABC transporter permease [Duncaniella sp.]